ncbi:MAG: sulfite reductase flavoprotein subunit alpha [Bacteroidetes bacterium]|jgi:sulfite reductase (NADPH) flavoprotein alpha-component|nr:sulfite reductase flavoprotein subunit alpha [Bacteroidota bacterium]
MTINATVTMRDQKTDELHETGFNFENADNKNILYVMFGSRTGNSESAANLAWEYSRFLGYEAHLLDTNTFEPKNLKYICNLLLAVSTHGEGDPPEVVENFYEALNSKQFDNLNKLNYSILALGDSTYQDFCKTGHDIDAQFRALGARLISPLVECDIDYEENAKIWVRNSVLAFSKLLEKKFATQTKPFAFEINKPDSDWADAYIAPVLDKKMLTKKGSERPTMLISLSLENSGLHFQPGDSIGIYTTNARLLVDKLLMTLRFDGTTSVEVNGKTKLLKDALIHDFELTVLTPLVMRNYAKLCDQPTLSKMLANEQATEKYCEYSDILDMIQDFPCNLLPETFLTVLRKLNPRLYSIASSVKKQPDQLDIVAGLIRFTNNDRLHSGVCSSLISDRIEPGENLPIYLEKNARFRLPEETNSPLIMIGAGTGVAPYRAFLQELSLRKTPNVAWLFFGEKSMENDFLFQEELENYFMTGLLDKLNFAFSRDQDEKKYVQDEILANSKDVYSWIVHKKAIVYLCGNKWKMAKAVRKSLVEVFISEGQMTLEQATETLNQLKKDRRLQEDVY